MAGSYEKLRRLVAVVVCLICEATLLTGSPAPAIALAKPFVVLQMNLCNSGLASCYSKGRAVAEAAALIRDDVPDVVTLNEVCQGDVSALGQALSDVDRDGGVVSVFQAAIDRPTAAPFPCNTGEQYGIGLVVHIPAPYRGYTKYAGIFPAQDLGDPEERAWLCIDAIDHFYACAAHLASTNQAIALAQCRYLTETAVPAVRARSGYGPTVVGGDLNLRYRGSPSVRSCVPAGYLQQDDGAVQHVLATMDFAFRSRKVIDMHRATDHASLLVALTYGR